MIEPNLKHAFFFHSPIANNYLGHIFKEIYLDRIYEPYVVGKKDLTVLDLGANIGTTAYYFAQFAKKVYALEPHLPHFDCLSTMVAYNKLQDIIVPINKAISTTNGPQSFYHNTNETMHSLNPAVEDKSKAVETVEGITLDKLFDDLGLEEVDIMKLDIEGTESELVASAAFSKIAPKVKIVLGESHSWDPRHRNQLSQSFRDNGFIVSTMPSMADIFVARRPE